MEKINKKREELKVLNALPFKINYEEIDNIINRHIIKIEDFTYIYGHYCMDYKFHIIFVKNQKFYFIPKMPEFHEFIMNGFEKFIKYKSPKKIMRKIDYRNSLAKHRHP